MPLARYFLFVGGTLLALLFIVAAAVPTVQVADTERADTGFDKPVIRIHSDRKWPERVVFDTSLPTIVPAQTAKAEAITPPPPAPTPVAEASAKARVREAFAQFVPPDAKKAEPKPQRKHIKIAKRRVAPPMVVVAQQPRYGFFANNSWNNSWW
jgi:hypothetical protein